MTKPSWWSDRMTDKLGPRLARSQAAISARVTQPVTRRPDTKVMLADFMQNPQQYEGQGGERLADYVTKTYGPEAARHILPYHTPAAPPPQTPEETPVGEPQPADVAGMQGAGYGYS